MFEKNISDAINNNINIIETFAHMARTTAHPRPKTMRRRFMKRCISRHNQAKTYLEIFTAIIRLSQR